MEKGRNPMFLELEEWKRRCQALEEKLGGMTSTYGKEIAALKGKVTQQDAQILLSDKASPMVRAVSELLEITHVSQIGSRAEQETASSPTADDGGTAAYV